MNLAARGARDMNGNGPEAIKDKHLLAQIREQAKKVYGEATLFAIIITIILVLIP